MARLRACWACGVRKCGRVVVERSMGLRRAASYRRLALRTWCWATLDFEMREGVREARRQYERRDVRHRDGNRRAVCGHGGDWFGWAAARVILGGVLGVPTRVAPA